MRRALPPLSWVLLAGAAIAQNPAPPGGTTGPITMAEVEAVRLEMFEAGSRAVKAELPRDELTRAYNEAARLGARRLLGRPLASPEVGRALFGVLRAAGRPGLAVRQMLAYLEAAPAGRETPPERRNRDEAESVERARELAVSLNKALNVATRPDRIRALATHAARIFPDGDVVYSTTGLWRALSQSGMDGAPPDEIVAQARHWAPLLRENPRPNLVPGASLFGRPAPPLVRDHVLGAGRLPSLRELRGSVVLLDFFMPQPGSDKTLTELRRLAVEHHGEVQVIGITFLRGSFQDLGLGIRANRRAQGEILAAEVELQHLARWARHRGVSWPIVVEGKRIMYRPEGAAKPPGGGLFSEYERIDEGVNFDTYGANFQHRVVLIDRRGIVRGVHLRWCPPEELAEMVERLLAR